MRTGTITAALVCAGALCAAGAPPRQPMHSAYYDGQVLEVGFERPARGARTLDFGPWRLGVAGRNQRPRDGRLNLYVVVPGTEYHADGFDGYDHNLIVNAVPESDDAVEWDVYWVLVLDPQFRDDLRSERDLLVAAQQRFLPGDLFEFADIPARAVLRDYLHIATLAELDRFRQKDGTLPRIVLLPAGGVAHMKIEPPPDAAAR